MIRLLLLLFSIPPICYGITFSVEGNETIASEASVLNDTIHMQDSVENSTQLNATGSVNINDTEKIENMTETDQVGGISSVPSLPQSPPPPAPPPCTVC